MAGDLELKLKINALVKGIAEVKGLADEVKRLGGAAGKKIPDPTDTMRDGLGETVRSMRGVLSGIAAIGAAVGVFKALSIVKDGLSGLVSEGIRYNSVMENARLGIATLITSQAQLKDSSGRVLEGQEALSAASEIAEQQMQNLRVANLQTSATFEQLATAFQIGLGPGLAAGLNLDQVRELTVGITQAAAAIDPVLLQERQLGQEVRALFDGQINQTTRIANTLRITGEQIRSWKSSGTLFQNLKRELEAFTLAGARSAETWSALTSNLKDAFSLYAGKITKPLFDQVKVGLLEAFGKVFRGGGLAEEFRGLETPLAGAASIAGGALTQAIRFIVEKAADLSRYLTRHETQVQEILGVAEGVLQLTMDLVREYQRVNEEAGAGVSPLEIIRDLLVGMGFSIAAVSDGFRVLVVLASSLGAVLSSTVLGPLELALRGFSLLPGGRDLSAMADSIGTFRQSMNAFAADYAGRFTQDLLTGNTATQRMIRTIGSLKDAEMNRKVLDSLGIGAGAGRRPGGGVTVGPKGGTTLEELANAEAVKEVVEALKKKAEALDLTNQAQVVAALKSKGATDAQIQEAKAYMAAAASRKKGASEGLTAEQRVLEALRDEAATVGMSREAAQLYRLEKMKASPAILAEAAALQKTIEVRREDQEAAEKAKKTAEENREAVEKTIREMQEANLYYRLSADEVKILEMAERGATDAEINQAIALAEEGRQLKLVTELKEHLVEMANAGLEKDRQEADAIRSKIDPLRQYAEQLRRIDELASAKDNRDPLLSGAEADAARRQVYFEQWKAGYADLVSAATSAYSSMQGSLAEFLMKPSMEGLKSLVAAWAQAVQKMVSEAAAAQLMKALFGEREGGGGGGWSGFLMSLFGAGVGHSGGMAEHLQGRRQVSPMVFVGAPRLHAGALLGLGRDEIPAILQSGEEVLSRSDPRNRANGAGAAGRPVYVRLVNVTDPEVTHDHMAAPGGEKVILNTIRKNRASVGQMIQVG